MKNIALITGSSRGIGFAVAKELDQRNFRTILTGRSQSDLKKALNRLQGNEHIKFALNFLRDEELDQLYKYLIEENLIPNVIIHNLGARLEGDDFPLSRKILNDSLRINLEIAIDINEKFLPYMIENQYGRIIHISSSASLSGKSSPAYVIAKSALNGYVKTMASYYSKNNIMFCAVLPGVIEHEGSSWANKKVNAPEHYQKRLEQTSLGRFGQPEEIASFIAELASHSNMMCAGGLFELCGAD